MITKYLPLLKTKKIILASQSPRRISLLKELNINFEVHKSDFPENISKDNIKPVEYVKETCEGKFNYFLEKQNIPCDLLITADSIIEFKGRILEKPKNKDECKKWLKEYSNNTAIAYTYMVIGLINEGKCIKKRSFITETKIHFGSIDDDTFIEEYSNSNEPYDKAGGFGIQSIAKCFIKGIEGDFYNVVGFPVNNFCNNLIELLKNENI